MERADRLRWIAALDGIAVLAYAAMLGTVLLQLGAVPPLLWAPALLLAWLAGILVGDLATGLVHWFCDCFFEEDTALIGRVLITPFREHHRDPQAMTRHGFVEISGNNAIGLLPFLAAMIVGAPAFGSSFVVSCWVAAGVGFVLTVFVSNWIHRWAHQRAVHPLVARLQSAGILLSPRAHGVHHRRHDRSFCVATGWCNPVLDRLGVLQWIEALVHGRAGDSQPDDAHATAARRGSERT